MGSMFLTYCLHKLTHNFYTSTFSKHLELDENGTAVSLDKKWYVHAQIFDHARPFKDSHVGFAVATAKRNLQRKKKRRRSQNLKAVKRKFLLAVHRQHHLQSQLILLLRVQPRRH